jgi:hypothetical protein
MIRMSCCQANHNICFFYKHNVNNYISLLGNNL